MRKIHHDFCDILAKKQSLNFTVRQPQANKLRDILESNWLVICENVKIPEVKDKLRKWLSKIKQTDEKVAMSCFLEQCPRSILHFPCPNKHMTHARLDLFL